MTEPYSIKGLTATESLAGARWFGGGSRKTGNNIAGKVFWPTAFCVWGALILANSVFHDAALADVQLITLIDSGREPPAGGNGDSTFPLISADGRYVLFASSANNLMLTSSNRPIPALIPAKLNVFLRDRTNSITSLVSVNLAGTGGGNGDSLPMGISTNGQYVLFESSSSDLVPGDTNGTTDVFRRDLINGETTLVSVSLNGGAGNGVCRGSTMTPDGRYVAFVSTATDLVAGDTNRIPDVFVRDLQAGTTTLISVGAMSTNFDQAMGGSEWPDITPDGRFVAFSSTATNLVPEAQTGGDIYVRDVGAGTTIWASAEVRSLMQSLVGVSNAVSYNHIISADGRFVAFQASTNVTYSRATNGIIVRFNRQSGVTELINTNAHVALGASGDIRSLDMTPDGGRIAFVANTNDHLGPTTCIYVWDAQSGTTILASGALDGSASTNTTCHFPILDASGRFVAFLSSAANLTTNSLAGEYHLYVRDLQAGTTVLVDVDQEGRGSPISPTSVPAVSADGRYVAFESDDALLVANDYNRAFDVFVRDVNGSRTEMISRHHSALASATPTGVSSASTFSVNADGRFIAFSSEAGNLVANDTNRMRDVFVRDLLLGTNRLVSVALDGISSANGISVDPAISGDGRYVAFSSIASGLVPGDTNNAQDVFVRDLQAGTTILVSMGTNGVGPGNQDSYLPTISTDGRYVLFRSRASNLSSGTFIGENAFLRDMQSGVTHALTTRGVIDMDMTPDGRFVAYSSLNILAVWDSQTATSVYGLTASVPSHTAVSPDGIRLAYVASGGIRVADRTANTNWVISSLYPNSHPGLRFSADGRLLTYVTTQAKVPADTNGLLDVYLHDFQTGADSLVSHGPDSSAALGGVSDWPDISPDGRLVCYRSAATNIVANDFNGAPDLFLFDRLAGANTLLSKSRLGDASADNRSLAPTFSRDGRVLLFQSWATDLAAQDFNRSSDLFAYFPLYATLVPGNSPGESPTLTWPAETGRSYHVRYKDSLNDPLWEDVTGTVTIVGNRGFLTDLAPGKSQRFYCILSD